MHESALTPRIKEDGAFEDNGTNNDKMIAHSDQDTQYYTLGGQPIMV